MRFIRKMLTPSSLHRDFFLRKRNKEILLLIQITKRGNSSFVMLTALPATLNHPRMTPRVLFCHCARSVIFSGRRRKLKVTIRITPFFVFFSLFCKNIKTFFFKSLVSFVLYGDLAIRKKIYKVTSWKWKLLFQQAVSRDFTTFPQIQFENMRKGKRKPSARGFSSVTSFSTVVATRPQSHAFSAKKS